MIVLLINN